MLKNNISENVAVSSWKTKVKMASINLRIPSAVVSSSELFHTFILRACGNHLITLNVIIDVSRNVSHKIVQYFEIWSVICPKICYIKYIFENLAELKYHYLLQMVLEFNISILN